MFGDFLFSLRNRLLSNSKFRAWAQKIPFAHRLANRRAVELFRISSGFIHSQVLLACVRLDLFTRLRGGPVTADRIAGEVGLAAERVEHLLRAAAALRLLERRSGGRFGLGVLGATMTDNESLLALVEHHTMLYEDLRDPLRIYGDVGGGTRMSALWAYASAEAPAALGERDVESYTALMAASQAMIAEQVLSAFSMKPYRALLDIGGGSGAFATSVARRWAHLKVTVADLPAVAAIARGAVADAGFGDRVDVVGVDATTERLPGGFDLVSMVRILHDHDDDTALELLAAARSALVDNGRLLIAEPIAGADSGGRLVDAYFNVYLLAMGSGRPRTLAQLSELLDRAGFGPLRCHRTAVPLVTSVISARR